MSKRPPTSQGGTDGGGPAAQPHDALVKRLLGPPAEAARYLASVLPPAVSMRVDWSTLVLCDGGFVDRELARYGTDLLYEAKVDGRPALVYLLFEHQSTVDPLMPYRVFVYVGRIWDRWIRTRKERPAKLPAVLPVVLYHGAEPWTAATALADLVDLPADALEAFRPHLPALELLVDDLSATSDDDLRSRAVSAAARLMLLCLKNVRHAEDYQAMLGGLAPLVVEVFRAEHGMDAIVALVRYIGAVRGATSREAIAALVRLPPDAELPEDLMTAGDQIIGEILTQLLEQGRDEGRAAGLKEGRQEGRAEGARLTVLKLLRLKFREVPDAVVDRIGSAELAELDRWAERVLTAATLDEILAE